MECSSVRYAIVLVAALAAAGCQTLRGPRQAPVVLPEPVQTSPTPASVYAEPACRFKAPLEILGPPITGGVRFSLEDEDWESRRCKAFAVAAAALTEISAEGALLAIPVPGRQGLFSTGLRATLTGRLFDHGETRLRENADVDIGRLADRLYRDGRTGLIVVGHSDASGSAEFNLQLSHKRAVMVAKALVRFGIPPGRIMVAGRGETQPIAGNQSEAGRTRNRRIEVFEYRHSEPPVELVGHAFRPMSLRGAIAAERRAAEIASAAARNTSDGSLAGYRAVVRARRTEASPFNFGGLPTAQAVERLAVLIGEVEDPSMWDRLNPSRQARATETAETLDLACIGTDFQDSAFQEGLLREDNTGELWGPWVPKLGLYGTVWAGRVNGHLVTLADMAVLAKGAPETAPTLYVHHQNKSGAAEADIKAHGAATATMGEEGLLYRAYFEDDAWPVRCIDLVFDRNYPGTFRHGKLYYENEGRIYAATYEPEFVEN